MSGRAGRGHKKGDVVIQTYSPDNFAIVNAANHDYESFYAEEIKMREIMLYPPFAYFSRWVFLSEDEQAAKYDAVITSYSIHYTKLYEEESKNTTRQYVCRNRNL